MRTTSGDGATESSATSTRWHLRLYVVGQRPKSLAAIVNLKRLCESHLAGDYRIEIIDLLDHPHLAARDQILAIPTLVRAAPEPVRKVVGDLSDSERVVQVLEMASG